MFLSPKDLTRFYSKYSENPSGCFLWHGTIGHGGYGQMKVRGKMLYAHRISYETTFGPIHPRLLVMHHCDIPQCVNPEHLSVGTDLANMEDKVAKGRQLRKVTFQGLHHMYRLWIMGCTHAEIGQLMGLAQSTVSRHLSPSGHP